MNKSCPIPATSKSLDENDKYSLKTVTSRSQAEPKEVDKLFPTEDFKMQNQRAAVSDANGEGTDKLLRQKSMHKQNEACCSSMQETFQVVEYIKGFHFVVYSETNSSDLELVTAEEISSGYLNSFPKSQGEMPNVYLEFTFNQIAAELKELKLPNSGWKTMISLKGRTILAISFTNAFRLSERRVTFNANSDKYEIIIEGRPAQLVGCPEKLKKRAELETLLRIVEFT